MITKLPTLPGGIWVVAIGLINSAAVTIPQQFPGTDWLPYVVGILDVLLLVLKYLQVRAEAFGSVDLPPGAAAAPAPMSATTKPMNRFFWG